MSHKKGKEREYYLKLYSSLFYGACGFEGIILIAVSAWAVSFTIPQCAFLGKYLVEAYLSLAVGGILCLASILAALYSCRGSNYHMIRKYILVAVVIGILQFAVFILALKHRREIFQGGLLHKMSGTLLKPKGSHCFNAIQERHRCCGVNNSSDWPSTLNISSLPESCKCKPNEIKGTKCKLHDTSNRELFVYSEGCYGFIRHALLQFSLLYIILPPILIVIQSCHLICTFYTSVRTVGNNVIDAQT